MLSPRLEVYVIRCRVAQDIRAHYISKHVRTRRGHSPQDAHDRKNLCPPLGGPLLALLASPCSAAHLILTHSQAMQKVASCKNSADPVDTTHPSDTHQTEHGSSERAALQHSQHSRARTASAIQHHRSLARTHTKGERRPRPLDTPTWGGQSLGRVGWGMGWG